MGNGSLEDSAQVLTVEDVVAQNQANIVVADKFFTQNKCVRQPSRLILHLVFEMDAQAASVAQQLFITVDASGEDIIKMSRMPARSSTEIG